MKDNKVTIKFACDQSWCDMSIVDAQTRYCAQCSKNVVDYSSQSVLDISNVHCGRFLLSQVSTIRRQLVLKSMGLALPLVGILGIVTTPNIAHAQSPTEQHLAPTTKPDEKNMLKISGFVRSKRTHEPFFEASAVARIGKKILGSGFTDFDGFFSFKIDTTSKALENIYIEFSYVGYQNDTLHLAGIAKEEITKEWLIELVEPEEFPDIIESGTSYIMIEEKIAVGSSKDKKTKYILQERCVTRNVYKKE